MAVDGDVKDSKPRWPFDVDAKSIKKVVIGHRAGAYVKELHVLLQQPRYAHVELEIAGPDLKTFRLDMHKWPRDTWGETPPYPLETIAPLA